MNMTIPSPYPGEIRARGWRLELDYERIRQSDTWALAGAEARPWLLMLWMVAWEQTPCGSLPGDEALIQARIEIPPRLWAKHRSVLMRGWELADDGRRYHRVLTERVVEMIKARRREADRKALARAREAAGETPEQRVSPTDVPRDNHGTPEGLHPESGTGTGTGTCNTYREQADQLGKGIAAPSRPPSRGSRLAHDWVLPKAWGEWAMQELGLTAETVRVEAAKFHDYWVAKTGRDATKADWLATWRNWLRNAKPAASTLRFAMPPAESARDRAARKRVEAFAPDIAVKLNTFTEVVDVVARSVG